MRIPLAAAALAATLIVLAGCGGGADSTVSGRGYSYELPHGWRASNSKKSPRLTILDTKLDTLVGGPVSGKLPEIIGVAREPSLPRDMTVSRYAEQDERSLRHPERIARDLSVALEPKHVHTAGRRVVDHSRAILIDYSQTVQARPARVRIVVTIHRRTAYRITLIGARKGFSAAPLEQILRSWRWE